jgi:hypothetical protein
MSFCCGAVTLKIGPTTGSKNFSHVNDGAKRCVKSFIQLMNLDLGVSYTSASDFSFFGDA